MSDYSAEYCGFEIKIESRKDFFNCYVFDGRGALVYGNFDFDSEDGLNNAQKWIRKFLGYEDN